MTHNFAKYLILATGVLGVSALPALANVPTCPSVDLATTYTNTDGTANGYECTVGNLEFSDFTYIPGGTNQLSASSIGVQPVIGADGPGFNFNPSAFISGANLSQDVEIGFTVTALSGEIGDIYIDLGNVTLANGGAALYTENFCDLAGTCSLFVEPPTTAETNLINLSSTALGGPVSSLIITKDLTLNTGSNAAGLAAVSFFGNQYSGVPEPRAVSLVLGLGLLAGFVFFKRRQVAQN